MGAGSLKAAGQGDRFILVDTEAGDSVPVVFEGALSDEVAEGSTVVLTGSLGDDGKFAATDVALGGLAHVDDRTSRPAGGLCRLRHLGALPGRAHILYKKRSFERSETFAWGGRVAAVLVAAALTVCCAVLVWCFFSGDNTIQYVLGQPLHLDGSEAW